MADYDLSPSHPPAPTPPPPRAASAILPPRRAWRVTKKILSFRRPVRPAPSRWTRFPNAPTLYFLLLLITAAGAFLRFWRLSYQAYWVDEAYTVGRIWGSIDHLLNSLEGQGFPPGWYIILRAWSHLVAWYTSSPATALNPAQLRSLPALIGTLMIPAMYLLARQFTDRKGALLVTLLTAVNPYLIYYSRDIKMYMALWFLLTLHLAFLFKSWTTQKHWLYWPLATLTGALAVAMHADALFIFALEFIFLLTPAKLKALDGLLWVLSLGLILILPLWWYQNQSDYINRATAGQTIGIEWNTDYTSMQWQTLASLPAAHLFGFLYPKPMPNPRINYWFDLGEDFNKHLDTRYLPQLADAQFYCLLILAAIMLLGLIPWRGRRPSLERRQSATAGRWWWIPLWIFLPTTLLALTWIPPDSPWYHTLFGWYLHGDRVPLKPIWEPRYLGFLLPAWLLWLAASLRRLPTWPLRTLALLFVLTVSILSALTNHLLYRTPPFNPTAQAIAKYWNPNDPSTRRSLAIVTPDTHYPGNTDELADYIAAGLRPEDLHEHSSTLFIPTQWARQNNNPIPFLTRIVQSNSPNRYARYSRVKTIILTDRDGDLASGPLTDARIAQVLGPNWKLVHTQTYRWYYEWRFYIFNTWRTRIYQRIAPPLPSTRPNTTTHP